MQVRRTGKGCLSCIVGSRGEAAAIDPSLPPNVYVDLAAKYGWRLRFVVETHVHADHLSRARQLATETSAQLMLPPQRRVTFSFNPIDDGASISIGDATLTALRTPGHTDESTAYQLGNLVVFTGDTLFVNGVGRPDLHADPEQAKRRAASLFASLNLLRALPPAMFVLPAHASEPIPFDGRPITARLSDVELARGLVGHQEWLRRSRDVEVASDAAEFCPHRRAERAGTLPSEIRPSWRRVRIVCREVAWS